MATHWICSVVAPKSRCMVGIATLTMLTSSTDMNMPVTSTTIGRPQPRCAGGAGAGGGLGRGVGEGRGGASAGGAVDRCTGDGGAFHGRSCHSYQSCTRRGFRRFPNGRPKRVKN